MTKTGAQYRKRAIIVYKGLDRTLEMRVVITRTEIYFLARIRRIVSATLGSLNSHISLLLRHM